MILFLADNHFDAHPGRKIYDSLKGEYKFDFYEDDLTPLRSSLDRYELLVLHLICGSRGSPEAKPEMEVNVKNFVDAGKPILLLHGASSAFSQWKWWRELVGLRWVRKDDPDGLPPSTHPKVSYEVKRCAADHPLSEAVVPFSSATDEFYINMASTAPITPLLEASWEDRVHVQCYVRESKAGGRIAGFIPGHAQTVVQSEPVLANIRILIDWLLEDR